MSVAIIQNDNKATLWHLRLGHINEKCLQMMSNQKRLWIYAISKLNFYEYCILAKQHKQKFPTGKHMSTQVIEYIHSNLWWPSSTATHDCNFYFLSIIEYFSKKVWIYLLKHKNQAFDKFKEWNILVKNLIDKKVKILRTYYLLEICKADFDKFCPNEDIQRHKTMRLIPQQNKVVERINKSLLNKSRSMLINSSLAKAFLRWVNDHRCISCEQMCHWVQDTRRNIQINATRSQSIESVWMLCLCSTKSRQIWAN